MTIENKAQSVKEVKEDIELLERELGRAMDHLLPLVNEYLKDVRTVRMSFSQEILNIIQSVRQLNEITKTAPELIKFADSLERIKTSLTPEFVELLQKIVNK